MYKKIISKLNKNQILVGVAVLAIIVTGVLISSNSNTGSNNILSFFKLNFGMSADAVAKKSIDYLNKSVLQKGQTAQLVSTSEESGVIKMKIKIGTNTYDSYATKDGRFLFPEAFTVNVVTNKQTTQNTQNTAQVAPVNVAKVAKTSLEAYVVSRCPFGLQIQRAISDAVKNTPSLAEFIKVRYIGAISGNTITSMHGDAEAQENFRQICIREEQNSKYWPYVSCQMKSNDAADGCLSSAGIDTNKLKACLSDSKRGLAYAKEDFALDTKYNIQGSPTLVLNGTVISEDAFGGRSSDSMRNIICSSSTTQPDFCKTKLNTTPAATSFSLTYSGSNSNGSGNSGSTGSNCAPAQ